MNLLDRENIRQNNRIFINKFFSKYRNRLLLKNKTVKNIYDIYLNEDSQDIENELIRIIECSRQYRVPFILKNKIEDFRISLKQCGRRKVYDYSEKKGDYLALACIIKNEKKYVKEFVDFYLSVGVEKIYLFDNDSTDNVKEILESYIKLGKVVYITFPGVRVQNAAYRYAIRYCKTFTRWLMLVDIDEFLFSTSGRKVSDVLKKYEDYPGIGVNWILFGPSGHDYSPEGLVVENYTETFQDQNHIYNRRIKSIVNPNEVESLSSPHFCLYKKGKFAVDESQNVIDGTVSYIEGYGYAFTEENHRNILRINHYITKSKEELKIKCERGYPDGTQNPNYTKSLERFHTALVNDYLLIDIKRGMKED